MGHYFLDTLYHGNASKDFFLLNLRVVSNNANVFVNRSGRTQYDGLKGEFNIFGKIWVMSKCLKRKKVYNS